jgi:small-conductance mechanosensitive channel
MDNPLEITLDAFNRIGRTLVEALPRLLVALIVYAVIWGIARGVERVVLVLVQRASGERSLPLVLSRLAKYALLILGFLIAATIIFPTVSTADLLAVLGASSIAIGFAFKDIFQNFLAGILILLRKPFIVGDQIRSGDYEGTVEDINIRSTVMRTYSGERVVIPNQDIFGRPVLVRTAYGRRRSLLVVGIGYGENIERAQRVIRETLAGVYGVLSDPGPWVYADELAPSSVNLNVYYWTAAEQAEVLRVGDRVLRRVKEALDAAGIEMPFPTRVVLFYDQTPQPDGGKREEALPDRAPAAVYTERRSTR